MLPKHPDEACMVHIVAAAHAVIQVTQREHPEAAMDHKQEYTSQISLRMTYHYAVTPTDPTCHPGEASM